jgi:hypothetical protein
VRKSVLTDFESEMLERSATKVKHSAEAAQFLHSEIVYEGDEPRGRCLTRRGITVDITTADRYIFYLTESKVNCYRSCRFYYKEKIFFQQVFYFY